MHFASDNTAGLPPEILAAIAEASDGHALGYGNDALTARLRDRIRDLFEAPEAEICLVSTGTAANALALATLTPPWGAIYCHPLAHIEVDECGAPEFYTGGAKLVHVGGANGRMTPQALAGALAEAGRGNVHSVQPATLSLTQLTECGTRYSCADLAALAAMARAEGLAVHLDGARFANALVAEGCSPAEMSWRAGVDMLVLGGTKNGLMGVEAVVVFDPARAWELQLRRKRAGHLWSKHRYLAAQMLAWLEDGLWLRLAAHANAMAARLEAGITEHAELLFPHEGNMLFARWPRGLHHRLREAGAEYYLWPDSETLDGDAAGLVSARLVTSWSTTEAQVDAFVAQLCNATT